MESITGGNIPVAPTDISGIGQWRELVVTQSGAFTPVGGTWAYFAIGPTYMNLADGNVLKTLYGSVGILPGNSRINYYGGWGFCWRIA